MTSFSGVLLVGGASERFGSPKALARFRGETLAERAWRLLGEVCDEVLAVGKRGDSLELPFPVLEDEIDERAAVHGLIAGLRASSNDVCLVLPVDCPLVTPEVLRSLAEGVAVPQTGPLPGAYPKALLPELEARVARGELSLRGVNPTVLEVDERLLANVNTRMELMTAAVTDWAGREGGRSGVAPRRLARPRGGACRSLVRSRPDLHRRGSESLSRGRVVDARVRCAARDVSGAQARRSLGPAGALRDRRGGGLRALPRLGPRAVRSERERRFTPRPRLPAAHRPDRNRRCARAERSKAATRRPDAARLRRARRATSGTTRSGPRRSSGEARSSPRSNASTGT